MFALFDVNGDGKIDRGELQQAAVVLVGRDAADQFRDELLHFADANQDGHLTKEELRTAYKWMRQWQSARA